MAADLGGEGAASADMRAAEQLADDSKATKKADVAPVDDSSGAEDAEAPAEGPAGQAMVTLPGFRMLASGGSRVFVQLSHRTTINETETPASVTYRLVDVAVPEKVNRLSLPTTHFLTPVARVRVEPLEEGGADLVVELRANIPHKTKLRKNAFGTMLSVDFPAVTATELETARVVAPPPAPPPEKSDGKKRKKSSATTQAKASEEPPK
ncbi:MAG: hypothetical protein EXR75_12845 [Myxococcales bacterium]|nr:hypothetical protein [Myxococcales bacterium]